MGTFLRSHFATFFLFFLESAQLEYCTVPCFLAYQDYLSDIVFQLTWNLSHSVWHYRCSIPLNLKWRFMQALTLYMWIVFWFGTCRYVVITSEILTYNLFSAMCSCFSFICSPEITWTTLIWKYLFCTYLIFV